MHKLIITASCVLCFSGVWAQEADFHTLVIHEKTGQIRTYDVNQIDSITFDTVMSVQRCKWYQTIENPGIADYLRDFEYDPNNYTYHMIFTYRGAPYLDERQDEPYPVILGDSVYYNLIPGRTYTLNGNDQNLIFPYTINTVGQLRMIKTESLKNIRDIGGWPALNGKHIKYGKIIRGIQLDDASDADIKLLRNQIGIRADLDLRKPSEVTETSSPLGNDIEYANISISYNDIASSDSKYQYLNCLEYLIDCLQNDNPVYLHCVYGADRTGILCMLLEGLLGVSQSNLDKDYEITSFSGDTRYRTNQWYRNALTHVLKYSGNTLQKKFRNWWLLAGATNEELDTFIALMTE